MIRSALSVVVMSAMLASTSALAEPVRVTVDSGVLVGELNSLRLATTQRVSARSSKW